MGDWRRRGSDLADVADRSAGEDSARAIQPRQPARVAADDHPLPDLRGRRTCPEPDAPHRWDRTARSTRSWARAAPSAWENCKPSRRKRRPGHNRPRGTNTMNLDQVIHQRWAATAALDGLLPAERVLPAERRSDPALRRPQQGKRAARRVLQRRLGDGRRRPAHPGVSRAVRRRRGTSCTSSRRPSTAAISRWPEAIRSSTCGG